MIRKSVSLLGQNARVFGRRGRSQIMSECNSPVIVKLSDNGINPVGDRMDHIQAACKCLRSNQVIAVPTDTIYGIAGLAQSTEAVQRIYNIKNRDTSKPIAISVGDVTEISKWGHVTIPQALLAELLPGPVTVVFERTAALNPGLNPDTNLVGIRVPDYGFVRELVREAAEPLALTSANPSNTPSTIRVQEFESIWPQLSMIFDGGQLGQEAAGRAGSTVVDLSKPGHYKIIREGSAFRETTRKLEQYGLTGCQSS